MFPLWLIVVFPLIGFAINGLASLLTARNAQGPSVGLTGFVGVAACAASFVLSIAAMGTLNEFANPVSALVNTGWAWLDLPGGGVTMSLSYDRLSAVMLLFITGIGTLIHLYSIGYMREDRGFTRFMAYLNLFMASMIILVLGASLPVTFLGWEGVGLCSYLLVGFWKQDLANGDAARKAFVMNRVGDLGFLLGAFFLWYAMESQRPGSGSLDYATIAQFFKAPEGGGASIMLGNPLVIAACAFLFLGCTGKSAQIPLLTWLPDAMAGPTPVSALIHAATMVTSGIYLCARLADVFVCSGWVMPAIAVIGCATAIYGAIAGLMQWDIKKVLAYSTVSQLGFMFMAVGVGAFDVALFHVFTHAFFKAALFLGAGSVIHALHHEQDMRRMGGLMKALPITYSAMWFGWYAIIGLPLGSGFMSKDLIIERLFFGHSDLFGLNVAPVIGVLALGTALLTAVYMSRMMYLTFKGPSRVDPEVKAHLHEAPFLMSAPVLVLGFGAMAAGAVWFGPVERLNLFGTYVGAVLPHAAHADHGIMPLVLMGVSVAVALLGWAIAWLFYRGGPKNAEVRPLEGFAATWTHGLDGVYTLLFIWPTKIVAWFLARVVDQIIVTGLVRGLGELCGFLGEGYAAIQRGRLRVSLILSLIGMVVLVAYLIAPVLAKGV